MQEFQDKILAAYDRESRHASAAAALDDVVMDSISFLGRVLDPKKPVSQARLRKRLQGLQRRLQAAHDEAAELSHGSDIPLPLVRLGPGGAFVRDIMEDEV